MKYSEIIRRVRQTAGDLAILQFTDATLQDWINDAVREIIISNNLFQKTATSATVVGTQTYVLPTDILKLYSITLDGQKIKVSTPEEWEALNANLQSGTIPNAFPQYAYVWAGQLNLYPPPDSVRTLKINYIYDPVDWDGTNPTTTSPSIPTPYHLRIVTYCLAQVALQDEDVQKYNNFMQMFSTGVIDLKHESEQTEDLYPSISVSPRDMGNEYGEFGW